MIPSLRRPVALALVLLTVFGVRGAMAQDYFGRNKVQYEVFDFRVLKTEHFDLYFYPAESLVTRDAGRMAERWYARHSDTFRHLFTRKALIMYSDHSDFEQTNVIGDLLDQGTQGVTEGLHTRVIMPYQGNYAETDHVLGHELVHVFQYDIAETESQGLQRLETLPGWLIEGMAEYFSLGRDNELTAMWMRDAVERDRFPTIRQLTVDPRFFPYRYGQALWAYVGGRWGDRAIVDVYRASLHYGWDAALLRTLGVTTDQLSKDWATANKALYTQQLVGRTRPQDAGEPILINTRKTGDYNVSPSISADGKYVAFYSLRGLFDVALYVADAKTGQVIKKLVSPQSNAHFDAINFVNSSGAWSPDGKHFAFIVDEGGNDDIGILNTDNGDIERTIKLPTGGSVSTVAWSPDGKTIALSGQVGGLSDLYLLDLQTEKITQLTHDRYADLQPAFSPDGQTIAFSSDRGAGTDFQTLSYSPLQLATISVHGGPVTVYSPFPNGKEINPQFTPDGKSLLFVSDQDGFNDIYRLDLAASTVTRVTRLATGVSGITESSPAITVSPTTGRMLFTVFRDQGHGIYALDAPQTMGIPVEASARIYSASILPPGDAAGARTVTTYLKDANTGLESGDTFTIHPYHPSLQLDGVSQPTIGASVGGPFGAGFQGGIAAQWGDQLSDQQITTILQANGTVQDIGGAVYYENLKHRWNWGLNLEHIPYLTGATYAADTVLSGGEQALNYYSYLERVFIDQLGLSAQYPFSTTRRLEFGISGNHIGYSTQVDRATFFDGEVIDENVSSVPDTNSAYKGLLYGQINLGLVGDNSYAAFVSPVSGERWRLGVSPTVGQLSTQTLTADYRRYMFFQPFTLAVRGLYYARQGRDAEDYAHLPPIFLGDETLIRGYGYGSIGANECGSANATAIASGVNAACPVLDRMFGSRVGVFNLEFRIPVLGTEQFGLFNLPFVPTEIAPFIDGGIAYSGSQPADLRWATTADKIPASCANVPMVTQANQGTQINCVDHIPVFSAGITARMNVLGYVIVEVYAAHPFQRPGKNTVIGVQLAPGW